MRTLEEEGRTLEKVRPKDKVQASLLSTGGVLLLGEVAHYVMHSAEWRLATSLQTLTLDLYS